MTLRPEHLTLEPVGALENNQSITGTVVQSVFVGSEMHLHVDVGKGRTAVVHHRHSKGGENEHFENGSEVTLFYSPNATHLIESAGG